MLISRSIAILVLFLVLTGCSTSQAPKQTTTELKPKSNQTCSCRSDRYNCNNFETNWEAQEVYDCCMQKVGFDVHNLDRDSDKRACEW